MDDAVLLQVLDVVHQQADLVVLLHAEAVDDAGQGRADALVDEV